ELSQKRAKACVDYLIYKGIDARRLIAIGYGESKLVNNCDCENGKGNGMDCTEEEHQINRRTTIAIIRTDFNPNEE
ncbi:MAG: OmpA family protein, partial [Bacteroidetes bacterium]|nr:OmpA family protein [Bacteroidota bacterium]